MKGRTFDALPDEVHEVRREVAELKTLLLGFLDDRATKTEEEVFDVEKCAEFLGLSTKTIYDKSSKGEIPYSKSLGKNRYLKSDLIEFIRRGRITTTYEIEEQSLEYLTNKGGVR